MNTELASQEAIDAALAAMSDSLTADAGVTQNAWLRLTSSSSKIVQGGDCPPGKWVVVYGDNVTALDALDDARVLFIEAHVTFIEDAPYGSKDFMNLARWETRAEALQSGIQFKPNLNVSAAVAWKDPEMKWELSEEAVAHDGWMVMEGICGGDSGSEG